MRWRTANNRKRQRKWRAVSRWLRDVERVMGAQRRGFRLIYAAPRGSKIRFVGSHGAVVAHPEKAPLFISWDEAGEITERELDAFFEAAKAASR